MKEKTGRQTAAMMLGIVGIAAVVLTAIGAPEGIQGCFYAAYACLGAFAMGLVCTGFNWSV